MFFTRLRLVAGISGALLLAISTAFAQDLGHKIPGLLGLDAGRIGEPGVYMAERAAVYQADQLRGADGSLVNTGPFYFQGFSSGLGVSYTMKLPWGRTFLTMASGWPIARVTLNVPDRLQAGIDRFGFGDPYILPVKLGWRRMRSDLVASYGIYLPAGRSALAGGNGTSSGQVTHEFSGGGTLYSTDRTRFLTGLAGYQLYMKQRGIDLTRGDSVQIQGGIGQKLFGRKVEAGLASYALWQVRDNRGTALPPVLRTARDRVYGLGPEMAVVIKAVRGNLRVRYEWDFGVRARPQGHIFVAGIDFQLWKHPGNTQRPPD